MNHIYDKTKDIVRAALFYEYEGKCFYSGEPLRYNNMHIDHIIPEYYEKSRLEKITSLLGLPKDFNINSLYNLVPCNPNVNQVKNKNLYPETFLGHCIFDKSSKKVDKIKLRIVQLGKEKNIDKLIAKLIAIAEGSISMEELEIIYDSISQEKQFEEYRKINSYGGIHTYNRSLSNVKLTGYLPCYPKIQGSCLITFRTLRLRDCMITLNHDQIISELFEGNNTTLESGLRKFVLQHFDEETKEYFVDLGNIRIPLQKEELKQLFKIIDDFYQFYMEEMENIYHQFNWDSFPKINNKKNNLNLCKINKNIWFIIRDFCRKFEFQNGNTEWHIFEITGSIIRVLDKETNECRTVIYPTIEESNYIIPLSEEVSLIWTDEFFWKKEIKNFQDNVYWSPIVTYNWLIKELIPRAIYESSIKEKKKLLSAIFKYERFKKNFILSDFAKPMLIRSYKEDLLLLMEELQRYFSGIPSIELSKDDLNIFYKCLQIIISKSELSKSVMNYIENNLKIKCQGNKDIFIKKISLKNEMEEDNDFVSLYKVDLIFRCMVVTLRDCLNHLSEKDIKLIKEKFNKYYTLMEREKIRRK